MAEIKFQIAKSDRIPRLVKHLSQFGYLGRFTWAIYTLKNYKHIMVCSIN